MPSVTRKKQRGRALSREPAKIRLLAAVEDLLNQGESYTELSVERLIQTAGVSRSTFYLHFADKGDLLRNLSADLADELQAAVRVCWGLPAGATLSDLNRALTHVAETYRPHADLLAAVVETAGYDPGVREHWGSLIEATISDAAERIAKSQADGLVRADVRPVPTARWLVWMIERGMYQLIRGAEPADAEAMIAELGTIIWLRLYG